ncbi:MAG: hypothetical protein M1814_006769 [Vezdaea aestivalis]|nr:MAG: hypothetical protein M1814_006769 [Vezdaea aestivalis]
MAAHNAAKKKRALKQVPVGPIEDYSKARHRITHPFLPVNIQQDPSFTEAAKLRVQPCASQA